MFTARYGLDIYIYIYIIHVIISVLRVKKSNFLNYYYSYTWCGRNNSHILKINKNETKQGTQKNILFIKRTYDAIFFQ